jgi:hypothetical protein
LGPWLDPKYEIEGLPKGDGEVRRRRRAVVLWFADRERRRARGAPGTLGEPNAMGSPVPATSRTFIPARLEDNPEHRARTTRLHRQRGQLDPVRRAQLEAGDWLVSYSAGSLFRRLVEVHRQAAGGSALRWRAWDRAATAPHEGNHDPDWTRGVKMSRTPAAVLRRGHASARATARTPSAS